MKPTPLDFDSSSFDHWLPLQEKEIPKHEVLTSIIQYCEFLLGEIKKMEEQTIALTKHFAWCSNSQLRSQINLERIYANLWVFIKDFTQKFTIWRLKVREPALLAHIASLQSWLDIAFDLTKEKIETHIKSHFQ